MKFEDFMKQLSKTNSTLDFFVDFDKVLRNIEKISINLNQLNYLIGKEDISHAVRQLYRQICRSTVFFVKRRINYSKWKNYKY